MKQVLVILAGLIGIILISCENMSITSSESGGSVDSVTMLTKSIQKDSSDYSLFLTRAQVYLNRGMVNPAFRDVNSALELNKDDPEVYSILSDLYFIIGKSDDAINALNKAIEIDPENVGYVLKTARTYIMLGQYDMAIRYVDRALSLDFENAEAYYLKGIYLLESGDTIDAITNMKIAGNFDTTFYETFMHTASLLNKLNDTTAIDYYAAALKARPEDEQALFMLALTYQDKGDFDKALDLYDQHLRIYTGHKQVHFNMGYIYLVEKIDYDMAILSFQDAINIDPGYVDAVYNLGRAYEGMELYDDARRQYRMALDITTNYDLAIEGLNRIENMQP